jgi:2-dehydropantoate 2-reductase
MNFIILGTGAIGSYIGGRLAAGGESVRMVCRPYQAEAMQDAGLRVTDLDGFDAQVPPSSLGLAHDLKSAWEALSSAEQAHAVVLLCVKGPATVSAAADIAACCPAGTMVVSLQNGVENVARIQAAAPHVTALAGMVPYNVVMRTPSHTHRATSGKLQLQSGKPAGEENVEDASHTTGDIAARFLKAGIAIRTTSDMRSVQWGKLLLNLNNPINALSNLPLRDQLLDRDFRVVLSALQREALCAMAAAKIAPAQLAHASPRAMTYILRLPNFIFTRIASKMLRMDASARSSMWDDVQKGRVTEVDDLCGAVVRLAALHGTPAHCNAKMCALMAEHVKGSAWSGRELRKALAV